MLGGFRRTSSLLDVLFVNKNLSSYERKQITKEFPRPDVHSVYTPALDNYLSSLITGAKGVDKESKRIQDQILDVVGPIAMALEHVSSLQSSQQENTESINIPYLYLNSRGTNFRSASNSRDLISRTFLRLIRAVLNSRSSKFVQVNLFGLFHRITIIIIDFCYNLIRQ